MVALPIPNTVSPIEIETQAIARQLLTATAAGRSVLSKMRDQLRWDDKLLAWTLENPNLRIQLFRFIDCLPALMSKAEIARHLEEYLGDRSVELPSGIQSLLNFTAPNSLTAQAAATTFTSAVATLAKKYIAGETLPQVFKVIEQLKRQSMDFTIDLLGEAVISEAEAQQYLERYLDVMTQLKSFAQSNAIKPQVSVKLTAFYSQFDPLDFFGSQQRVSDRLRILLRHAKDCGIAVHFDMEQYRYKTATLEILKSLLVEPEFRDRSDIGLTIQAYLRDSYDDLQALIVWAQQRETPMTVRLVKGAYWDQETILAQQHQWESPVYSEKSSSDANFEQLTTLLLNHHHDLHAAIASHNVRSQAHAIALARHLQIPAEHLEFQMLYGMADGLAKAIAKQGHRVRIYCPYGDLIPGMAYLIRRLLENTANHSVLRQQFEARSIDALLAPPIWEVIPKFQPKTFHAPDTDYSILAERDKAFAALDRVRQQFGQTYQPWINGKFVNTDQTLDSRNPSKPEEIIGTVGQINLSQADEAIAAAKAAFPAWKSSPIHDRISLIRQVGDRIAAQRNELNAWMAFEAGKPLHQADLEVSEAIDFCQYYADQMERLATETHYDIAGETNHTLYRPQGIALVISPWNFPLAIPVGMAIAALVTGNCVLLKPSGATSIVAAKFSEILNQVGFPPGVFQFIPGPGAIVGDYLVQHPDVNIIAFTGSYEVGSQIYAKAAIVQPGQNHLKRVIAEMGGKNAIVIDESADLDQAVQGVVASAFGYSGQKCSAASRVIVLASVYEAFTRRLIEATRSLSIGNAAEPSTRIGPVIDANAQQRIRSLLQQYQIDILLELPVPETGYFVSPTIVALADSKHPIAQTEIFGPVLAVLQAESFEAAIAIANDTPFALTGGLYSRTPSHIAQAKRDFEVGNLYINRTITGAVVGRQPFGGFKRSGVGTKAGGPDYLLQFLEARTITENIQRQGFAPLEPTESR